MSRTAIEEAVCWLTEGAKFTRESVDVEVCNTFLGYIILIMFAFAETSYCQFCVVRTPHHRRYH
jgi:hypothetical protein